MRNYIVTIRTISGRDMTVTTIEKNTTAAMISVCKSVGEIPARLTGRPA